MLDDFMRGFLSGLEKSAASNSVKTILANLMNTQLPPLLQKGIKQDMAIRSSFGAKPGEHTSDAVARAKMPAPAAPVKPM